MKYFFSAIIINLLIISPILAKDRTGIFICKNIQALEMNADGSIDTNFAKDSELSLFTIKKKSITHNYAYNSNFPSISTYEGYFSITNNNNYLSDGSEVFIISEDSRDSTVSPNYYAWNEYGFQSFRNIGYGKVRIYVYDCLKQ